MQISVALKEDEQETDETKQEGQDKLEKGFKQVDINLGFDMKQIKGEEQDCIAAQERLMDVQKGVLLIGDLGWDPDSKEAIPPPSYKDIQLAGERYLDIQYRQIPYPKNSPSPPTQQ
eukprot:TRINITY_DN23153_c0_g1_i7.p3 TRINITY_DN23153_c0_g1~~TRINITY_DN23153_c0_g1_i7.p3  ORF type:complete len:117 (-),score=20.47 TRINITY_DN23153_c0_g1_i7:347-697(-)